MNSLLVSSPLTALSRGSWLSSPPKLRADIEVVSSLSAPSWTAGSWFLLFPFFFFSSGAAPGSLKGQEFWWVISSCGRDRIAWDRFTWLTKRYKTVLLSPGPLKAPPSNKTNQQDKCWFGIEANLLYFLNIVTSHFYEHINPWFDYLQKEIKQLFLYFLHIKYTVKKTKLCQWDWKTQR